MMRKAVPPWVGQSLRFGMVAPVVFLVDLAILSALDGLGPYAGRVLSLAGSVVVGFLLNRFFTFRATGRPSLDEVRRYAIAAALGIGVNYGVFSVAITLGLPGAAAIGCGMLAAAVVTFIRFRAVFNRS